MPAHAVSAEEYRAVMRRWPSGVTIVTTRHQGRPHGMTASAFTSVSIAPPLVLVVIDKRGRSHDYVREAGAFCVSMLAEGQSDLSDRFAGRQGDAGDRFDGVAVRRAVTGLPYLADALAYVDCEVDSTHDAGDHTIFVGRVVACGAIGEPTAPLVYHDARYKGLSSREPDR